MKKNMQKIVSLICIATMTSISLTGCGTANDKTEQENAEEDKQQTMDVLEADDGAFQPSLDTEKSVTLDIAGFMANFESLDQVINDFNEYYPNVQINYEQNSLQGLVEYVENSQYVDIFMTNDANISSKDWAEGYVMDECLDLSEENLNMDAIDPELLKACTVDGKLARIPLAKTMCGMVVNKTLLEKEGLQVPQTYEEFLNVCEALKEKGYTPIQSAKNHAYSDMILPMAMSIIGNDKDLVAKVNADDTSYADSLSVVYERLAEIIDKGYTSLEVNETYPDDNYDGAILSFFEGNVPFWITNTESFSGMKKRESKSEAFSANPFEYEFVDVPLGDNGVYDYEEPWYGFSVYKDSEEKDYAIEFLNFLCREEELNKFAEVKGMPSVAVNNSDDRFENALNPAMLQDRYVVNGEMDSSITNVICDAANKFGNGSLADANAAVEFVKNQGEEE